MSTKIRGHRIEEKSISVKHITDDFSLSEIKGVKLNYPTHDNKHDLNEEQYNVITQGGNADSYHNHTGGGGGANGIYTNVQRDVAILKIMMELNGLKNGLPKAIMDTFTDTKDIDYGVMPPSITNITSEVYTDQSVSTSLEPNMAYYYYVQTKNKGGWTTVCSPFKVTTPAADITNKIKNNINVVLPKNSKGIKIFRQKGELDYVYEEFTSSSTISPDGSLYEIVPANNYNTAHNSIKFEQNDRLEPNVDILNSINSPISRGLNLYDLYENVQLDSAVYCFLAPKNNRSVNILKLVWSGNSLFVPISYEVYYTEYAFAGINELEKWKPLSTISNMYYVNPLEHNTDGVINGHRVTGNTKRINNFIFEPISEMKGIKIVCKEIKSGVQMALINVLTNDSHTSPSVIHKLNVPVDLSKYNTAMFDMMTFGNPHENSIGLDFFSRSEDSTYQAYDQLYLYNSAPNNSNIAAIPNRTIRDSIYIGTRSDGDYDKIRISFKRLSGVVILKHVTVTVANGIDQIVFDYPETLTSVTFNGGKDYYEGTDAGIDSDFVDFKFPKDKTYDTIIVSYVLEQGNIYIHVNGNTCQWYKDGRPGVDSYISGSGFATWRGDYTGVTGITIGKTGVSKDSIIKKVFNDDLTSTFSHVLNISGMTNIIDKIRYKCKYNSFSNNTIVSTLRFSKSRLLFNPTDVTKASCSTTGEGNISYVYDSDDTNSWKSALTPALYNPLNTTFSFKEVQNIDCIKLTPFTKESSFKNFKIQISNFETVTGNEPDDGSVWVDVNGLDFIPSLKNIFTGIIIGSNVTNCNIVGRCLNMTFNAVACRHVRILYYETIGNVPLNIRNIECMSATNTNDYELVHTVDGSINISSNYNYTDIGIDGTIITQLPNSNTTASSNVMYNSIKQFFEVTDKSKKGILVTKEFPVGAISKILTTIQSIQETSNDKIDVLISVDGGFTWESVPKIEYVHTVVNRGTTACLRFELYNNAKLNAYALLYSV